MSKHKVFILNEPEDLRSKKNISILLRDLEEKNLELTNDNIVNFIKWMGEKDNLSEFFKMGELPIINNALSNSYLENIRIGNRSIRKTAIKNTRMKDIVRHNHVKQKLYSDINEKEDIRYQSKKIGKINMDNVNIGKGYIYVDSIFNNANSESVIRIPINNNETNSFNVKSTPYDIKNLKSVVISDVFLPPPTNTTLVATSDIIKIEFMELGNLTHREYPNINYMFQFKIEEYGDRFRLIPLNNNYRFTNYISILQSVSFRFHYQNLVLDFPSVSGNATLTFGNPTTFTTNTAHGLASGDKISIYQFEGSPSIINDMMNSLHIVTVVDPLTFTIPIDSTGITGLHGDMVIYYAMKNKTEFNLELTYL